MWETFLITAQQQTATVCPLAAAAASSALKNKRAKFPPSVLSEIGSDPPSPPNGVRQSGRQTWGSDDVTAAAQMANLRYASCHGEASRESKALLTDLAWQHNANDKKPRTTTTKKKKQRQTEGRGGTARQSAVAPATQIQPDCKR